ncbi:hypothetical protein S40285_04114 [Stachybotrys chlorohalonatus IBT 40285]|uniref:Elongation factor 1 alpha-like protein n=1 Tax=Stachybotrys chlorohalonatus (strain IBT 40285) TaxID=1283841 RepID=A0A084QHZ3_STAC4|nr:hypothetical protein S40285_04114 [Stachybotrys chlorohalonata IBT 40285]
MAPAYDDYYSDDVADYDGDDFGEESDDMSPEDRASMNKGMAEVRKVLGKDASKVTAAQIQDALWHYYYDVDKSVAYLKKTFIPSSEKPTPKKAPEGESGCVFFSPAFESCKRTTGADHQSPAGHAAVVGEFDFGFLDMEFPVARAPRVDHRLEFSDMPWLNTPQHRQAVFLEPPRPRGGLLGGGEGTPKMSKLQALAAARKRNKEDQKGPKGQNTPTHPVSGMKNLAISEKQTENQALQGLHKRQKLSGKPTTPSDVLPEDQNKHEKCNEPRTGAANDAKDLASPTSKSDDEVMADVKTGSGTTNLLTPTSQIEAQYNVVLKAKPSAFGAALFGSAPAKSNARNDAIFPFPYTKSPLFNLSAFSKPSPDDIVMAAQAKAGKKANALAKSTSKAQGKAAEAASGIANMKINDAPPPKSKGLDVLKEFEASKGKRSVSFVVVGHVDAGKSTLMGRLLLELKFVEERTVDKYRRLAEKSGKQSFALAWIMDQRPEERDRGVTIDIGTHHFETDATKFTILDAPGHRDFIPNMIAGASQADFAILVIDANTGAYEKGLKGQTREHVLLLRSLGLQRIIVAVNKLDMVGWSKERFDEIAQQVSGFLTGLGFQDKHITFIPISGLNGSNIVRRIEDETASWYTGSTLIEGLEASGPSATRALKKPFRMAISEVFRSQQGTTTLAGRIDAGTIQVGDSLIVQPSGESAYIKSIMVDSEAQEWAVAGQSVSIALTNIDPIHLRVGDILCHATDPITCSDTFTMRAMAFEHLMPMPVDLHRGRLHAAGQIQSMAATLDKSSGNVIKKKPKVVQPGEVARVSIKLGAKVPLEAGQRVVLRSGGETIAAGLIE